MQKVAKSPGAAISSVILLILFCLAIFSHQIAPYDPYETYVGDGLGAPSTKHLFGLDFMGRDVLSRVIFGTRLSLLVGLLATSLSLTIGSLLGIVGGYYGGRVDFVICRVIDLWLAFPAILFALVIVSILGKGLVNVVLAVGIASIPRLARIVRSSVLSVKGSVYVEAARGIGSSSWHIMARHIVPNVVAPILVLATLQVGTAVMEAASLNFLGLGAAPPTAEWGLMVSESQLYLRYAPWTLLYPGIALFLLTVSMNLLGDRLRELLDPKLRGVKH